VVFGSSGEVGVLVAIYELGLVAGGVLFLGIGAGMRILASIGIAAVEIVNRKNKSKPSPAAPADPLA
jgi:hypothetical protein